MEDLEDEIQAQACKFQRLGNGGKDSNNEKKEVVRRRNVGGGRVSSDVNNNNDNNNTSNFQSNWQHHSSRIIRVSRTSGGKDRHSKVMTSKGLRDRRVRLSVTTAIQFYDLQDRLGYDQPSKAVEWLIKAATDSISELPSLNTTPETPKQLPSEHEKTPSHDHHHQQQQQLVFDEANGDDDTNNHQYHQNQISLSKSACSSNSETSKGSGLSLSRSEIRVKARERARERAAKEKENDSIIAQQQQHHHHHHHHHNVNNNHNMSQTASFTELLTGAIGTTVTVPRTTTGQNRNQWSSTVTPMDYFSTTSVSALSGTENHSNHELQLQQQQQQHFPFMHENLMQPQIDHHQQNGSHHHQHHHNDYNLNFTISSGLAAGGGYNRGTLQSNSPSLNLPHLQRFSTMDGSSSTTSSNNTTTNNNLPFFIGAANANANANAAPSAMENHHHLQFSPFFDSRLQLFYGDGSSRHSDHKGKGNKNN